MMQLQDKVVIVTGSGRGIGKGIAAAMAAQGATVVVNDIDSVSARATAQQLAAAFTGPVLALPGDVANPGEVKDVVEETIRAFGRIDVLVNNAGIIGLKPFTEITLAEWENMLAVHLTGTFLFSQAVLPQMSLQGYGKIINISSNWGQRGAANAVHYSAVKAGLIGFTKALAREVGPQNINVNAVAPGPIETEMIEEEARMLGTTVQEVRDQLCLTIPLNRLGSIEDVAASVVFLAGQTGDFYCGQIISPNGGEVI